MNDPELWGPSAWVFLHSVALNYPSSPSEADKVSYYEFFKGLGGVLPCIKCRDHYISNFGDGGALKTALSHTDDPRAVFKWTVDLHNMVNMSNRKPSVSYEEAFSMLLMTADNRENLSMVNSVIILILVMIIAGALGVYAGYSYKKNGSGTGRIHSSLYL